ESAGRRAKARFSGMVLPDLISLSNYSPGVKRPAGGSPPAQYFILARDRQSRQTFSRAGSGAKSFNPWRGFVRGPDASLGGGVFDGDVNIQVPGYCKSAPASRPERP